MSWLYRLQQRLALTGTEAAALLLLGAGLTAGLAVRQLQAGDVPAAATLYAEADAQWASLNARADSAALAPLGATEARAPADSTRAVPIPSSGFADTPARRRSSAGSPVRMNLNTADAALLQRLPRIGPALAGRIIAYREANGPFRRVEDVTRVRGIGEKTLEKLAPYLYVE